MTTGVAIYPKPTQFKPYIILFRIFTPSNYKPSPIPHFSEIALLSFYVQYKNKYVFFLCLVPMNKIK